MPQVTLVTLKVLRHRERFISVRPGVLDICFSYLTVFCVCLFQLVKDCNEKARLNERIEELVSISRQLVFKDIKSFPLVTGSRWVNETS